MQVTSRTLHITFQETGMVDCAPLNIIEKKLINEIEGLEDISFFDCTATIDGEGSTNNILKRINKITLAFLKDLLEELEESVENHNDKHTENEKRIIPLIIETMENFK